MPLAFKKFALAAARAADDKKAESVLVLDARKSSPVTDYLVIVTALSRPHLEAIEDKVDEELEALGMRVHHRNRPQTDHWRVLDYGGLIVHMMTAEARELYQLERLNDEAKEVAWRS